MSCDPRARREILRASGGSYTVVRLRQRYGDQFTQMLIDEANETRALRGFGPKDWVYKGYGIYQYDLQHVPGNEAFIRVRAFVDTLVLMALGRREITLTFSQVA